MRSLLLLAPLFAILTGGCQDISNPAPKEEIGPSYLVLTDDHSKVAGTIENGDTTLSLRWPNKVWIDGRLYNTDAPRVYRSEGVLGIIASAKDSISGVTAYYGLDVVDAHGNEVFTTSCDTKHQCSSVNCTSCALTIIDCNGSCSCKEELATDSSYCEHSVSTMMGEDLQDFPILSAIKNGCISMNTGGEYVD